MVDESRNERAEASFDKLEALLEPIYDRFCADTLPVDILYHYTNTDGLMGILKNREIWSTHYNFLNDSVELKQGEQDFLDVAQEMGERLERDQALINRLSLELDETWRVSNSMNAYVTSFTTRPDQLSQWRAYGQSGAGYCLGFSGFRVASAIHEADRLVRMHKCIYDKNEFSDLAVSLVAAVQSARDEAIEVYPDQRLLLTLQARQNISELAAWVTPRRKHSAFEEEDEWRLLVLSPDSSRVSFRRSDRGLVPYYRFGFHGDDIEMKPCALIVGPMHDKAAGVNAANMFIRASGYEFEAVASRVPLR